MAGDAGQLILIRDFSEMGPTSHGLALVPLTPFYEGRESLAAIADRVLGNEEPQPERMVTDR